MGKTLMKPDARCRPLPKTYVTAKEILGFSYDKALAALADYDGPVRFLLERIISSTTLPPGVPLPQETLLAWAKEAKVLMNVIYKVNGCKDRWTDV